MGTLSAKHILEIQRLKAVNHLDVDFDNTVAKIKYMYVVVAQLLSLNTKFLYKSACCILRYYWIFCLYQIAF